jgi:MoxR-like ATPase
MAKSAKAEVLTDKDATKFLKDVLAHYGNIESARGKFMLAARREREAIGAIHEALTAKGVSQRASKINVKIVRALEKIKGWMTDLEEEDRKMVERLAKAQKDKKQLLLFGELPKATKPKKAAKDNVVKLDDWDQQAPVAAE